MPMIMGHQVFSQSMGRARSNVLISFNTVAQEKITVQQALKIAVDSNQVGKIERFKVLINFNTLVRTNVR